MAQKPRLLIVEDEAAIRSGLVDVFVYHGYEVDTADHGDEGLRKALSGQFDLILLDVMLPGVDGFEICNRIRQQDRQQVDPHLGHDALPDSDSLSTRLVTNTVTLDTSTPRFELTFDP